MTTSTPNPSRSPSGCLYLMFMLVALLFVLNQPEPPAAGKDDS